MVVIRYFFITIILGFNNIISFAFITKSSSFCTNPTPSSQTSLAKQSKLHHDVILPIQIPRGGSTSQFLRDQTQLYMGITPAAASLIAGSLAGAIGVGVAFPLDTLKTKSQVLGQQMSTTGKIVESGDVASSAINVSQMNMIQLFVFLYRMEGISGFFGGVKGMMVGQAIIKATAFSTNAMILNYLSKNWACLSSTSSLLLAACTAGFVTSFLVSPIERIKVMMQVSNKYKNEFDCLNAIVKTEGWYGLLSRGLGTTLARETPSYGIYFFIYGWLSQLEIASSFGNVAPLIFGALSGMAW